MAQHDAFYDEMIKKLDRLEKAAMANIDSSLSKRERLEEEHYITSKYEILRITSTYGLLLSTMSIFDGLLHAFLHSSENRRKLLIKNKVKVYIAEDDEELFGTLIESGKPGYKKKKGPKWIEWKGCFMQIPKKTFINISPNITWPSIYMKSKKDNSKNYNEISIHERSWNADVYATEPGLVKRVRYEEEEPIGQGVNRLTLDTDTDGNTKFLTVDLIVLEKLKKYDIVMDIPFRAPYMDVLTKVNFKNSGEDNPEILLTFGMT